MERTFSPMVRQFSAIAGLQQAYTLVYSLDPDGETGCRLNNNITPARGNVKGGEAVHRKNSKISRNEILRFLLKSFSGFRTKIPNVEQISLIAAFNIFLV